ncbi:unnamed protein product [marine sediment metagenome]|uniref:Acyltransferase 3 domain-containing protein n=1 Tax=marine sediment metagenome TaxID=412755 RepID=X1LI52_9ZZZZ
MPYIDWLRVITVLLLVPFHSALPFIFGHNQLVWFGYNWWITNSQKNLAAHAMVIVLDQYHMSLLFLIAGAATWFSLGRRTGGEYLVERIKRLFVPITFGSLVFVVTNHFLSQHHYFYLHTVTFGNFLQHYPTIVQERLVPFTTGWCPGALWFIWYLLFYTLVFFPLFLLIRRKGDRFIPWLAWFFEKRGAVFLLAIPIALVQIYPPPPITDSWVLHNFPLFYHLPFFVYGFFSCL